MVTYLNVTLTLTNYQNFHHAFLPAKLLAAPLLPVVLAAEAAAAPVTLSFLVPF